VIGGLVLAAGGASRFGSVKQLADLRGRPLVEHALLTMSLAPVDRAVVVLGAEAEEVVRTVDLHGITPVLCARWEEGQSASLACGLAALADCDAVVVTLGDLPRLAPEAISRVVEARGGAPAVRATYGGRPGHPVLLERDLLVRLRDVTGDHGARNLLRSVASLDVPCDDLGGGEDVDTPDQLAALRHAPAPTSKSGL
jgi:nicotine blue oxidoreductase